MRRSVSVFLLLVSVGLSWPTWIALQARSVAEWREEDRQRNSLPADSCQVGLANNAVQPAPPKVGLGNAIVSAPAPSIHWRFVELTDIRLVLSSLGTLQSQHVLLRI